MNIFVPLNRDTPLSPIFPTDNFASPLHLLEKFEEYIQWTEDNPKMESKLYGNKGELGEVPIMRLPTIEGFYRYSRTIKKVIDAYRGRGHQWEEVFSFIEDSMYAISIEGAAAGLLKDNIVMAKLNLSTKKEVTTTNTKRVVILHTPDNGRAIIAPQQGKIEDAQEVAD